MFSRSDGDTYEVAGITLQCLVCKRNRFQLRHAQLHSGTASFFNLEWLGPNVDCLVCTFCGYIHWFFPVPDPE
jgi:hypothetical protein